jgi:hypothetical protein
MESQGGWGSRRPGRRPSRARGNRRAA